jgi:surface polysaccharide O-acyltransferase-like enzyme
VAIDKNYVKPRNEWLDVVRGLAILGVVTVHTMIASNSVYRITEAISTIL